MRRRRLAIPPSVPDYAGRLELLRQADRHWQPPPLEGLKRFHGPIMTWLDALGWVRWRLTPEGPRKQFMRHMLCCCLPWPTVHDLECPFAVMVRKGETLPDLRKVAAGARQALEAWLRTLPLVRAPEWFFDIAIHTTLNFTFCEKWEWTFQVPGFAFVPPVLGLKPGESLEQFGRRALRDFERSLTDYVRQLRHAYGLGLRVNTTRKDTMVRDAEWTARFLGGTPAYRMDEVFEEDAVLRAVHRFCDRIGLNLATVRRQPVPFGRAHGRSENAVLRQALRSLRADGGSQSILS